MFKNQRRHTHMKGTHTHVRDQRLALSGSMFTRSSVPFLRVRPSPVGIRFLRKKEKT